MSVQQPTTDNQPPTGRILVGDVLEKLERIPDGSVQCIVTSPPYWGLRVYGIPPSVWCADPECDHDWVSETHIHEIRTGLGLADSPHTTRGGAKKIARIPVTQVEHAVCTKCGAWRGCFGLEPTVEMYLEHTLLITRALRRVLADTGVIWWNIGDSYAGSWGNYGAREGTQRSRVAERYHRRAYEDERQGFNGRPPTASAPGMKALDCALVPQTLSAALRADGWYVRSPVIWEKPNPKPESVSGWRWERHRVKVNDEWVDCPGCEKCAANGGLIHRKGSWRPTSSYEHILMLTKTADYYGDGEPVREAYDKPLTTGRNIRDIWRFPAGNFSGEFCTGCKTYYERADYSKLPVHHTDEQGRAHRTCRKCRRHDSWLSHFATFPLELPKRCRLSSTSEYGQCPRCGAPWSRILDPKRPPEDLYTGTNRPNDGFVSAGQRRNGVFRGSGQKVQDWRDENPHETTGWRPSCDCRDNDGNFLEPVPQTVLDPFLGSGTTALAAEKLGRRYVGIELNPDYAEMARQRIAREGTPLFSGQQEGKPLEP